MVQEDLYQKIAKLEVKVDEHDRKLQQQEEKNDLLTRVIVLQEQQQVINKEHSQQMKKFDETLNKVNLNLDGLNKNLETLDKRVGKLEHNDEEGKISMPSLGVKILVGICMGIPTLITLWLALQLGLK